MAHLHIAFDLIILYYIIRRTTVRSLIVFENISIMASFIRNDFIDPFRGVGRLLFPGQKKNSFIIDAI